MGIYRPAILSASLGRAWLHGFDNKIKACANAGFQGVEVFYEDLEHVGKKLFGREDLTNEEIVRAADHVFQVCRDAGLEIIGLQPFLFYEGLLDRREHSRLIEKIHLWFDIVKHLHTDTIQIPANFLPASQLTDDLEVIVGDLRELAILGQQQNPVVRFAYENLCWSTHIDTWEKAWNVVEKVDCANFGLCLDTFNIAGRVWADPASPDGKMPDAEEALQKSVERMIKEVRLDKVFYIQIVDAEKMDNPLVSGHPFHVDGQPPRMSWSRNARAFMYETDRNAYLPVEKIAKALIHDVGYKGYISMELFSRTMSEEGENVPAEHANRGFVAWKKLVDRLNLES